MSNPRSFSALRTAITSGLPEQILATLAMSCPALALSVLLRLQPSNSRTAKYSLDADAVFRTKNQSSLLAFANSELQNGRVGQAAGFGEYADRVARHCFFVGEALAECVRSSGITSITAEDARTIGILHELGLLHLASLNLETFLCIVDFCRVSGVTFDIGMQCMFSITHQSLGAVAADSVGLDERIAESLRKFEAGELDQCSEVDVLLRICEWSASKYGLAWEDWGAVTELPTDFMRAYEGNQEMYDAATKAAAERTAKTYAIVGAKQRTAA
jgi:hypothetical protein